MLVVRAAWEQRAIASVYAFSKGIFSVSGLLTAAKNLFNATVTIICQLYTNCIPTILY